MNNIFKYCHSSVIMDIVGRSPIFKIWTLKNETIFSLKTLLSVQMTECTSKVISICCMHIYIVAQFLFACLSLSTKFFLLIKKSQKSLTANMF